MKRGLLVAVVFLLMLALAGCDRYGKASELTEATQEATYETFANHSWNFPEFTSIEELVESHKTVREGRAVDSLAEAVENANFLELDKLYVPTAIPEGYYLYKITVIASLVRFEYLPENDMVSTDAVLNALNQGLDFSFVFYRPGMDVTLWQHATEEDLIDGKYFFCKSHHLIWEFDEEVFELSMPLPLLDKLPNKETKIAEMIKYAEVEVVELGD